MGILFKIPFYFSYAEAYKETMDPFELAISKNMI
jgi:hypothetical protein